MALHPANKPATRHIHVPVHFCCMSNSRMLPLPDPSINMAADDVTNETLRRTPERHCRHAFGDQTAPLPLNHSCACLPDPYIICLLFFLFFLVGQGGVVQFHVYLQRPRRARCARCDRRNII